MLALGDMLVNITFNSFIEVTYILVVVVSITYYTLSKKKKEEEKNIYICIGYIYTYI